MVLVGELVVVDCYLTFPMNKFEQRFFSATYLEIQIGTQVKS